MPAQTTPQRAPIAHRRHDDGEDEVPRGVVLHGHARVAHEIALRFGCGDWGGGGVRLARAALVRRGPVRRVRAVGVGPLAGTLGPILRMRGAQRGELPLLVPPMVIRPK